MDIQNFQFIQSFSKKQQKLDVLEKRQASLLLILKNEYKNLKVLHKPRINPREKYEQFQNLKKSYTFKLPDNKEKPVDNKFKNGWLQTSLTHLSPRVHELRSLRNKMVLSGNTFSKRNQETFERQPIKKVVSAPTQLELKQEMLVRRMEFGNTCSSQFVKKYAAKRPATSNPTKSDVRIQNKQLKVPQKSLQRFSNIQNESKKRIKDELGIHNGKLLQKSFLRAFMIF